MIAIIVAYDKNNLIGNNGRMPWHIEGEQQRFKELTTGNVVVMGRRTYEEVGYPLPNRTTIVVSNAMEKPKYENCYITKSFKSAIALAEQLGFENIYVGGGSRIFEEALTVCDKMYITEIQMEGKGDTFFPSFDKTKFTKTVVKNVDGRTKYTYVTYNRK